MMSTATHKNTRARPREIGAREILSSLPLPQGERVGVRGLRQLSQLSQNGCKNPVHVGDSFIIPKAKCSVPLVSEESISPRILGCPVRVLPTVSFDDKAKLDTQKIGNVRPDRHLPTKLCVRQLPISQARPKQRLSMSLLSPQRTSSSRISLFHTPSPHPSPQRGEGVSLNACENNRS